MSIQEQKEFSSVDEHPTETFTNSANDFAPTSEPELRVSMSQEVNQRPLNKKKLWMVISGAVGMFAVIAWSWHLLASMEDEFAAPQAPFDAPTLQTVHNKPREEDILASPSVLEDEGTPSYETTVLADVDPDRGSQVNQFLKVDVLSVRKDATTEFVKIGTKSVIPPQTVSVVNLWATWCEPCEKELPAFKQLFASADWQEQVRFVPIMVNSDKDAEWANRKYRPLMPDMEHFLVDNSLQGFVQESLADVAGKNAELPVTFLLDCRRRVRWLQVGEITDMAALKAQIDPLVRELTEESCIRAARILNDPPPSDTKNLPTLSSMPTSPSSELSSTGLIDPWGDEALLPVSSGGKQTKKNCGNSICEAAKGEDCHRCPQDCACTKGRKCTKRPDQTYICGGGLLQ